ncbi:glycoside hydrolase family 32 protein [Risungbinella massiliensis]|uniref:glycoside hydrolase family 32 protein n=1 Tax=Risungbinella massiliensis TaxID=1329796 RepID=UPI0005CC24E1|nr:glycoside hydrolase family 32 protein [Risungbinella massiliensis]
MFSGFTKSVAAEDVTWKDSEHRPGYHFSVPDQWMNDPQRPIYFDGEYHYYYLYNRDYSWGGNGTEWRHATSKDLVIWEDKGVAIPKYTNKNGDPWTGSFVVDNENTAGFGYGAVIAIVTQPSADGQKQEQFLWYSTDRGKTFKSYSDEPIMKNPGEPNFRDPKVIWDSQAGKWVMTMAEGDKIGFYESRDLKHWVYISGFMAPNIGVLECPDLFLLRADDGNYKWVLGVSANARFKGDPNTYAYWTGNFNGKEFKPDKAEPTWLDYGFDWYGGVTFEDGPGYDKLGRRYAIAWMNNWDYPHNTPTKAEGFNGVNSIVRKVELKNKNGRYTLVSNPTERLDDTNNVSKRIDLGKIEINGNKTIFDQADAGKTYSIEADISWENITNFGFRLRESDDGSKHIDAGLFVEGGFSFVNRKHTGTPSTQFVESKAPFDKNKKKVHLRILVDNTSVEMFIDDGEVVHSNQVFSNAGDTKISAFSTGGTTILENVKITEYKNLFVGR